MMTNYPAPNVKSTEVEKSCRKAVVAKALMWSRPLAGDGRGRGVAQFAKTPQVINSDTESLHPAIQNYCSENTVANDH